MNKNNVKREIFSYPDGIEDEDIIYEDIYNDGSSYVSMYFDDLGNNTWSMYGELKQIGIDNILIIYTNEVVGCGDIDIEIHADYILELIDKLEILLNKHNNITISNINIKYRNNDKVLISVSTGESTEIQIESLPILIQIFKDMYKGRKIKYK